MALVEQLDMIQTLTANRIDHALDEPNCGRMLGDGCACDLPAIVGQHDQHVKQPKQADAATNMLIAAMPFDEIPQEGAPGWGRRTSSSHHQKSCGLARVSL